MLRKREKFDKIRCLLPLHASIAILSMQRSHFRSSHVTCSSTYFPLQRFQKHGIHFIPHSYGYHADLSIKMSGEAPPNEKFVIDNSMLGGLVFVENDMITIKVFF